MMIVVFLLGVIIWGLNIVPDIIHERWHGINVSPFLLVLCVFLGMVLVVLIHDVVVLSVVALSVLFHVIILVVRDYAGLVRTHNHSMKSFQ